MRPVHVPEEKRVTILDNGGTAWGEMEYSQKGKVLSINHTGVSPQHRGEGLGETMMITLAEYARKNDLAIRPVCPFAAQFFYRHSEYKDLLAE